MSPPEADGHHSIGDVANETGITPETLRVWERRYGKPVPVRMPSGHRRYTSAQIAWLRDVAEGLARGLRPGKLVRMKPAGLRSLLGELMGVSEPDPALERVLGMLRAFDATSLRAHLQQAAAGVPALAFLEGAVAPLVGSVGRAWAEGRIHVRHEHFFTSIASDVLRGLASDLPRALPTPRIVLATLEGEWHGLGLQMARLVAAARGLSPYVLGVSTPDTDLVRATVDLGADVLGLSVSLATGGVETDRRVGALRAQLPEATDLVVGGDGARRGRRGARGVHYIGGLGDWDAYLAERTPAESGT